VDREYLSQHFGCHIYRAVYSGSSCGSDSEITIYTGSSVVNGCHTPRRL
jgi:hypothetical protein